MAVSDEDIVIVCHCKKHSPVFHVYSTNSRSVGEGISYVDPEVCPEDTWDKIADNSKTYVWGINCPVGPIITNTYPLFMETSKQILNDILIHSWRVLKMGGKVVFPGPYDDKMIPAVQDIVGTKWIFSIENTSEFPLSLVKKGEGSGKLKVFPKIAVFTKVVHEGGKMKRRVKRKTKRRVKRTAKSSTTKRHKRV